MGTSTAYKFATIFDMPAPCGRNHYPSHYLNKIEEVTKSAAEVSMLAAAEELHEEADHTPSAVPGCIDIPVSFDSSWKTRGFYSNLGFGSAISALTKKVLDYELLNRICEKCNRWSAKRREEHPDEYRKWYDSHKANCKVNHTGSSQSMEPAAAKLIWSRSVEKRKLCYTTFIGDGDSKSFQQVCDLNLYNDTPVRKEECLAHVSKRLKKTLCTVKKNTKNHAYIQHKLAEPKATYISSNYSTAILQHKGQSPAVIAEGLNIFLSHASGTHEHCPTNTWCQWIQTSTSSKQPPTALTNFTQLALVEYCHCYRCTDSNTLRGYVLSLRTEIPNDVVQGLVGILSHTKGQVATELLRGIGVKGFFSFIDVKLSEVGKCSRRLFRRGRCLYPLAPCVCRAVFVCTTGVGEEDV